MEEQEEFWKREYATTYIRKNSTFDAEGGVTCWKQILKKTRQINSTLECGSNIGRNIEFLNTVLPASKKSIIEISPEAFNIVSSRFNLDQRFNGSILESNFATESFDLVYTIGVLIHIHPNELIKNLSKIFNYSKKYIVLGEYFNRTPVMISYQGKENKLFKQDFGKLFIENFPVQLVDYGFLWGYLYDDAGFDDITYWVFEKK